jgi:MFS transporter, UMF1 family
LALGLGLGYVIWAQGQGQKAAQFVPVTMLITAVLYALAALPTFLLLRERALPQANAQSERKGFGPAVRASFAQLAATWRNAQAYGDFVWLLACAVAYQAGIAVVIALAAVYAEQVLGFKQQQTMMLIFLVNIAAALGAFGFGHWQDRLGHRRALAITLVGWIVMTLLAYLATSATLFWFAAVLAGMCMGSSQSAGRAMAGLLAPAAQRAEFYGLWTFAVRLSAIIGPLTYGLVTWLTAGNHRNGIVATGLFFVIGLVLLRKVDMQRGADTAQAADAAAAASVKK